MDNPEIPQPLIKLVNCGAGEIDNNTFRGAGGSLVEAVNTESVRVTNNRYVSVDVPPTPLEPRQRWIGKFFGQVAVRVIGAIVGAAALAAIHYCWG